MKATFWGVRGSIATPGRATAEFGGNTSCVELQAGADHFIFDCGTGIRELGRSLVATGEPVNASWLLTHSHWDHIQGFPFFAPAFVAGNRLTVYGPQEHTLRLSDTMAGQMQYRYFPIGLENLAAEIKYHELREEKVSIGSAVISTHYLNHTLMAVAYKLEANGRSVIYATDTEPFFQQGRAWESSESRTFLHKGDEELAEFFSGADLLIIDSQYTANEYPSKLGWGHATPDYALDLAISANVGTLVLFHHDPTRIDTAVTVLEELAKKRAREEAPGLEVMAAAEGLTLNLKDASEAGHGASDVLIEPFAPTQLRSRVDSWLMRIGIAVDRRVRLRAGAAPAGAA